MSTEPFDYNPQPGGTRLASVVDAAGAPVVVYSNAGRTTVVTLPATLPVGAAATYYLATATGGWTARVVGADGVLVDTVGGSAATNPATLVLSPGSLGTRLVAAGGRYAGWFLRLDGNDVRLGDVWSTSDGYMMTVAPWVGVRENDLWANALFATLTTTLSTDPRVKGLAPRPFRLDARTGSFWAMALEPAEKRIARRGSDV